MFKQVIRYYRIFPLSYRPKLAWDFGMQVYAWAEFARGNR